MESAEDCFCITNNRLLWREKKWQENKTTTSGNEKRGKKKVRQQALIHVFCLDPLGFSFTNLYERVQSMCFLFIIDTTYPDTGRAQNVTAAMAGTIFGSHFFPMCQNNA